MSARVADSGVAAAAPPARSRLAIAALTALALVAFAANSVICRAALGGRAIDAGTFAFLRLAAGAAVLLALRAATRRGAPASGAPRAAAWRSPAQPIALFVYAAAFAFAYLSLSAGTGALILFGCVQATMLLGALRAGERFAAAEVAGLLAALGGLAYLVAPGLAAPSPLGSALMAAAGIAWGVYSLRGRGSADPLGDTARNFAWAVVPAIVVGAVALRHMHLTPQGVALAALSGAVTSGLGYVVWFAALRGLSAIQAAIVQLAVPAIAAAGGVALLGERVTLRLAVAAVLILGGIGLAIALHPALRRGRR